jgi:nicotinamidase/pyrazinamidase
VPGGAQVIAPLNACIAAFRKAGLVVVATRDWHPPNHLSFREQGGPWPAHCVAGTPGAAFATGLKAPEGAWLVSKATSPNREAYSGFEGTDLVATLRGLRCQRLWIGGLATDYCVLATGRDALAAGLEVLVIEDGVRAVNVHAGDGAKALAELDAAGARRIRSTEIAP